MTAVLPIVFIFTMWNSPEEIGLCGFVQSGSNEAEKEKDLKNDLQKSKTGRDLFPNKS